MSRGNATSSIAVEVVAVLPLHYFATREGVRTQTAQTLDQDPRRSATGPRFALLPAEESCPPGPRTHGRLLQLLKCARMRAVCPPHHLETRPGQPNRIELGQETSPPTVVFRQGRRKLSDGNTQASPLVSSDIARHFVNGDKHQRGAR
jgi:hypothetical protein